jgi:hypothetical protein
MTRRLAVPSLGGGVQSSPLLLTACEGELTPPDTVIFSDTHGELPAQRRGRNRCVSRSLRRKQPPEQPRRAVVRSASTSEPGR